MNCPICHKSLSVTARFCPNCGQENPFEFGVQNTGCGGCLTLIIIYIALTVYGKFFM